MNQYKKVAFYTLGCKLNFSETSTISRLFEEAGFAKVNFEDQPDIYVINTCSVTENADKKCKQLVKKGLKINPKAFVCIVGCFAQLKPEEIGKIPGVDLVLGANEKFNIIEHIEKLEAKQEKEAILAFENIKATNEFVAAYSYGDRTRSFLKVQDGCDYFCTFCTIPLARGKSRNTTIANTVLEANKIAITEVKEVVLTGVNIGDFGQGGPENFEGLIRELDLVDGIDRYRISSIEPNLLSDNIIRFSLSEAKKFVPHFHVPLQSGSNRVLQTMRRKYLKELYAERVATIKQLNPDCCIGVDVIVGFPGETDEEFLETVDFIKDIDVSYLHVFTYSERANTSAMKLGEPVSMAKRKERSQQLHILSDKKKRAFYETQVGKIGTVLFESEEENGLMFGFTENYIKVKMPYVKEWINTFQKVRMLEIDRDQIMKAELVEELIIA